jgi:hypothetical protein
MADRKLWEVMADAYCNANNMPTSRTGMMRSGIAAELRALADEVVPEEPRPGPDKGMMPGGTRMYYHAKLAQWEQRMATRALLLNAAAEAEGRWQ